MYDKNRIDKEAELEAMAIMKHNRFNNTKRQYMSNKYKILRQQKEYNSEQFDKLFIGGCYEKI